MVPIFSANRDHAVYPQILAMDGMLVNAIRSGAALLITAARAMSS